MTGKDCVAIASDMRYGIQQQTIATNMHKVFKMGPKLFVGLSGLITDMQTLKQKFDFRLKMYALRENRPMKPKVFANLVSTILYEKRFGPFFCEPIIAGLDEKSGPYISAMDLIGAPALAKDFVVTGTASEELYGVCEAFWKPNMGPDELFETISQALLAAVDRDCLAGWGAIVHVITKDGITTKQLKSRKD
eukprot:CAMPEP_0167749354 /NCGR_PEP_ID=MMETSP0110_2-20121227/5358_1 /TAXON_ID=629695 /ORGANISM="Gymnochlora sp., Strain CCMP2014" /LENGTH=191 /DNA_ID=CAMNT_0007634493 /DNA_START=77 /DNA_END=652 /DNA_ORIENTATION=-